MATATVHGPVADDEVRILYPVNDVPPSAAGAFQFTVSCSAPAVVDKLAGALAVLCGVAVVLAGVPELGDEFGVTWK